eukprot:snap_masked-scaffold_19-processed-gene-0.20-mRNA-1 protein AED:1.00 eAED:1.00 QI:0/-1/0/0/-1/1/1/0/419
MDNSVTDYFPDSFDIPDLSHMNSSGSISALLEDLPLTLFPATTPRKKTLADKFVENPETKKNYFASASRKYRLRRKRERKHLEDNMSKLSSEMQSLNTMVQQLTTKLEQIQLIHEKDKKENYALYIRNRNLKLQVMKYRALSNTKRVFSRLERTLCNSINAQIFLETANRVLNFAVNKTFLIRLNSNENDYTWERHRLTKKDLVALKLRDKNVKKSAFSTEVLLRTKKEKHRRQCHIQLSSVEADFDEFLNKVWEGYSVKKGSTANGFLDLVLKKVVPEVNINLGLLELQFKDKFTSDFPNFEYQNNEDYSKCLKLCVHQLEFGVRTLNVVSTLNQMKNDPNQYYFANAIIDTTKSVDECSIFSCMFVTNKGNGLLDFSIILSPSEERNSMPGNRVASFLRENWFDPNFLSSIVRILPI